MVVTIQEYIESLTRDRAILVARLADIVRTSVPDAEEDIKWGQPVFFKNGPFCFIKVHKTHVNFGFWWGTMIPDPGQILEGAGDTMRHIKVRDDADIDTKLFAHFASESAALNAQLGDPSKVSV